MKPFQERVVAEKSELDGKLEKLKFFLASDLREQLPADEVGRLVTQESLMQQYSNVLGDRIAHFSAN